MTLREMSQCYASSAAAIHGRIVELRGLEQAQMDRETASRLHRRIEELTPLWREARELAALTAHYYDRRSRGYGQHTL